MAGPTSPPLVDAESLRAYLEANIPGGVGEPFEVRRHRAGHSNETFFVTSGDREWVLRRPPRGAFLPTAHDVGREFRVLSALAGSGVRAPRPVLWCEDPSVIGVPFYLMERVRGWVFRDALPPAFATDPGARAGVGDELVDALVELHAVDPAAAGLEGFGRPAGYLERQVARWRSQLALTEPHTRVVRELHATADWLSANLPPGGEPTIVHGDYKLDNTAFEPAPPARLVSIFDWEMSTLGDPLADVGWMVAFWREASDPDDGVMEAQTATDLPGFRSRHELVDRYGRGTGRDVSDLTFYVALAVWKCAILLEGSYARHLAGMTDDPIFELLGDGVPGLARRALRIAKEGFE
jgi:aminoglycoside phosphotransferase (APT) family kinase protein